MSSRPARAFPTRSRSKSFSISSSTEARAAEAARLHQPDEERVELVVFVVARLAETPHGVLPQSPIHVEALAQDGDPLRGEILGQDADEASAREERAIAGHGLKARRRHPRREPAPLAVLQTRRCDPVTER